MRSAALLLVALAACSAGAVADPWVAPPLAPETPPATTSTAKAPPLSRRPKDIVELFEARILPTCSLNGGVCHNSNNYPDLRNVAAMQELVGLPCGLNTSGELRDACEPAGDHLVASGVDVVIERASFDEASATTTITTRADVPVGALGGVTVQRLAPFATTFSASAQGVVLVATGPRTVLARLADASPEARTFFAPKLPLREDRLWPADANSNGIAGAAQGWREIVPGRPDRSWVIARLWDEALDPELMPRQCRTWDDTATRALGCWIEALRANPDGTIANVFQPIDYARCTYVVPKPGRCGTGEEP